MVNPSDESWCADTSDAVFRAFSEIQRAASEAWHELDIMAFYFGEVIDGGLLGPAKTVKACAVRARIERMMDEMIVIRKEIKSPPVVLTKMAP
jgi:hypothetical protein